MSRKGRVAVLGVSGVLGLLGFFGGAATPSFQQAGSDPGLTNAGECRNRISGFRQAVSWRGSDPANKRKFLIEAETACGSKFGHSFELREIHLTVRSGKNRLDRIPASRGTYFTRLQKVLIAGAGGTEVITLDLKTGEVRSVGEGGRSIFASLSARF